MSKYIFLILFAFPGTLAAQIAIQVTSGYGTYKMQDLKDFQQDLKLQFPDDARITDEFPAYYYYEGCGSFLISGRFHAGVSVTYASTGGRVYYGDYSGYLRADQLVKSFSGGFPMGFYLTKPDKSFTVQFDLRPMISYSSVDVEFEQNVSAQQEQYDHAFHSTNLALQPEIIFLKRFRSIGVHLQAGYYQTILAGKLQWEEDKSLSLVNNNEQQVFTDWSGLRAGLGVSVRIN